MKLVKLRDDGGNLVVTIPRALVRELALTKRHYVLIRRTAHRRLEITPVERSINDARH